MEQLYVVSNKELDEKEKEPVSEVKQGQNMVAQKFGSIVLEQVRADLLPDFSVLVQRNEYAE